MDLFYNGTKIKRVPMLLLKWTAGKNGFVTHVQVQSQFLLQTIVLHHTRKF